ncbi:pseudouridine-5' phosphatase [Vibrio sp. JCM 19236]|nr:pseudouridine-5' phosphatase [Vibrio sp. JCM 19236]
MSGNKYKALLFDMDGLIFDTESVYKKSWVYAAEKQGLELPDSLYQTFIGVKDVECERMLSDFYTDKSFDLELFKSVRDKHFHSLRAEGIDFKPGFAELVTAAKAKNYRLALITSSTLPDVKVNFTGSDYLNGFEVVVTAEDVTQGKPNPEGYLKAIKQLGLKAEECVVFEDSNNGMRAGLSASCVCVMVPDLLPAEAEIEQKADHILGSLDQAIALL